MRELPTIETDRLLLRAFALADAPDVQRLAGDRAIAAGTLTIPHPYPDGAAEAWIGRQLDRPEDDDSVNFALERREDGSLVGSMGLAVERAHDRAELGYWVGKPYWGHGFATEAGLAVLRHGFEALRLNRVYAFHFANNPASGRVLQKLGMRYEGCRRQHTLKWGEYLDNEAYGILRAEWERS